MLFNLVSKKFIVRQVNLLKLSTQTRRFSFQMEKKTRFVLIDTDAGTDDAHAIFMLLRAHQSNNYDLNVVGINCVSGNTSVDNVLNNVSRVLKIAGVDDVPVFKGAEGAMVVPYVHFEIPPYHGYDGFGDIFPPPLASESKITRENGISALIRLSQMYKGELEVLAMAPLTNLALAVRVDPSVGRNLKAIHIMGGNMEGQGNTTACAEFNFLADPEAAFVTLSSYQSQIYIYPWETCLRFGAMPYSWRIDEFNKLNTPSADLIRRTEEKLLVGAMESGRWIPCDQLPAAAIVDPDMVKETVNVHCTVELQGLHSRGLMVVDHGSRLSRPSNIHLVTNIDQQLFQKLMLWGLSGP